VDPPLPTDPTFPIEDYGPGPVLGTIAEWSRSAPDFTETFERPTPAVVTLKFPAHIIEHTVKPDGGYNTGREGKPNHGVIHHGAQPNLGYDPNGNHSGLVRTLMGPGAPTAQTAIKDFVIVNMVDERDTAATNTRWMSNTYGVNAEVANDTTTTDKPSAESHETAAWFYARQALKWSWQLPVSSDNLLGHKKVSKSPTACPGELDVEWVIARVNAIIEAHKAGGDVPAPDYSIIADALRENTASNGVLSGLIQKLIELLKSIFKGAE